MISTLIKEEVVVIEISPAKIYLANLSENSRPTMHYALMVIAKILEYEHYDEIDWSQIEYKHTAYVRLKLIEKGYAAATINRKLACLRSVLKEAWRLGMISAEKLHRASDLKKVKGNSPRLGRIITTEEQKMLVKACMEKPGAIACRDYAIISVARLGLRSVEVSRLNLSDYQKTRLMIFGKGNKHRPMPLPSWAINAIEKWLAMRGKGDGPLFTRVKNANVTTKRMSRNDISKQIKKIAVRAGLFDVTSHCFRFTFVSEALARGLDLASVQRAVGHSTPGITAKYDLRDQSDLCRIIEEFEDISPEV